MNTQYIASRALAETEESDDTVPMLPVLPPHDDDDTVPMLPALLRPQAE
jgi:hypothetical protein